MNLYFNLLNGASRSWAIYICYCLFNIWNIKNTATFRILFYLEYEWNECNIDVENETHYIYIFIYFSNCRKDFYCLCCQDTLPWRWRLILPATQKTPCSTRSISSDTRMSGKNKPGPEKPRILISNQLHSQRIFHVVWYSICTQNFFYSLGLWL